MDCKPGFIRNPASGRCVDADGPTGRKLRGLKALPKFGPKPAPKAKPCPAGKVRNPRSGRCMAAMTLCHKMNGVNPSKFGNAVAAQCRNALTKTIAGVPARLPPKSTKKMSVKGMIAVMKRLPNDASGDNKALAVVKKVASAVNAIAKRSWKAKNMSPTKAESARLRALGFKLKKNTWAGVEGTMTKHGVTIRVSADQKQMGLDVSRQGSKTLTAGWQLSQWGVDVLGASAWPEAARVLRSTLTQNLRR